MRRPARLVVRQVAGDGLQMIEPDNGAAWRAGDGVAGDDRRAGTGRRRNADADLRAAVSGLDLAEICITSGARISDVEGPEEAFRLADVPGVSVVPVRASGVKCARSWKYFDPATAEADYPDVTPRDASALRELRRAA